MIALEQDLRIYCDRLEEGLQPPPSAAEYVCDVRRLLDRLDALKAAARTVVDCYENEVECDGDTCRREGCWITPHCPGGRECVCPAVVAFNELARLSK